MNRLARQSFLGAESDSRLDEATIGVVGLGGALCPPSVINGIWCAIRRAGRGDLLCHLYAAAALKRGASTVVFSVAASAAISSRLSGE